MDKAIRDKKLDEIIEKYSSDLEAWSKFREAILEKIQFLEHDIKANLHFIELIEARIKLKHDKFEKLN